MARRQATASPPLGGGSQSDVEEHTPLFPMAVGSPLSGTRISTEQFHLFVGDDNRHEVAFTSVTRDVEEAVGTVDLEVEMTQASIDDVIVTVFDTGVGSAQPTDYVFSLPEPGSDDSGWTTHRPPLDRTRHCRMTTKRETDENARPRSRDRSLRSRR